jgi:hypothetical protein
MSSSTPQLPVTTEDSTLWFKYFTIMAVPVELVMLLSYLIFGLQFWVITSLLTIAGSMYILRETEYFREWESASVKIKVITGFVVLSCIWSSIYTAILVLVAIPFVKKFTDLLGYTEPKKLGEPFDTIISQFRRITGDGVHDQFSNVEPRTLANPVSIPNYGKDATLAPMNLSVELTPPSTSWLANYRHTPLPLDLFQKTIIYTIVLPKNTQWQAERALNLIEHLLQALSHKVAFQIAAEHDKIEWHILDIGGHNSPSAIIQAIRAVVPEAEVVHTPYLSPNSQIPLARIALLTLQLNDFVFPLRSVLEFKNSDPLATIVNHLSNIPEGVRFTHTLYVKELLPTPHREAAQKRITKAVLPNVQLSGGAANMAGQVIGTVIGEGLNRAIRGNPRQARYEGGIQSLLEQRVTAERLCVVYDIQQIDISKDAMDRGVDIGGLVGAITGVTALVSDHNGPKPFPEDFAEDHQILEVPTTTTEQATSPLGLIAAFEALSSKKIELAMVLSPGELTALWHLPHRGFTAPEVQWLKGVKAPPEIAKNQSGVRIGDNEYAGQRVPIYLADKDRTTGMYVLGKPGMGKSTYMHSLIHQDIARGFGVAVIDPHGKLVNDILGTSIPKDREDDLVVIDLNYDAVPAPLNPLIIPGEPGHIAVGRVLATLSTVYDLSRAERALNVLKSALVTLGAETTPTLRDIVKLFNDPAYRDHINGRAQETIQDDLTWEIWQEYEELTTNAQQERVYPVVHRLRALYGNNFLYPMLCNPDSLDVAEMIAKKKIVLVSLHTDRDKVPEDERRLIGAILVSTFQMAGMKSFREGAPNFYLYIDEVQNFVTTSIGTALTEARKYGLSLHMANQFLDQLKGDTLKAVLGAIGSMVVFQVGHDDARELAPYFQPQFTADDFVGMERYTAAVKAFATGQSAFSLLPLEPPGMPKTPEEKEAAKKRAEELRQLAYDNSKWKRREEVMDWLHNRYPLPRKKSQQVGEIEESSWTVPPKSEL